MPLLQNEVTKRTMNEKRQVAIIHYNTPELTEACILSLRKHGGDDYHVLLFDNSTERPFTRQMDGVTIIDNTKGQIIDFDTELEKYPEREEKIGVSGKCVFGSVKHMMTVQKLFDLLPDGFVLMESDILLKQSVESFFRPEYSIVGYVQKAQPHNPFHIGRVLPMLCWINVPMLRSEGVNYFDPNRSYGLVGKHDDPHKWYDTGASLLEDILAHRPKLKGLHVDIRNVIVHYGSGSWDHNNIEKHHKWLEQYRDLWYTEPPKREPTYTVFTYIFGGYEKVHEVMEKDPDAEYILVTDDPHLKSRTWEVIYDPSLNGRTVMDKCYYTRFHPWKYANTDTIVRIDGSIGINHSFAPLVKAFKDGDYDRCLMIHPTRDNFKEELDVWCNTRNYQPEVANRCVKMMQAWGYDFNCHGMIQGCFEIVKNTPINHDINRLTYALMTYTGGEDIDRLDQHITTFVIHTQFPDLKVLAVSQLLITDGNCLQWYHHGTTMPIAIAPEIPPMLFNKPIAIWNEPKIGEKDSDDREKDNHLKSSGKPKTKKSTIRKGK